MVGTARAEVGRMRSVNRKILEQVIAASAEPVMIVRLDHTDWPVVLANAAFESIGGADSIQQPFADVIEDLVGRELALEISESLRSQQESSFAVEVGGREYLLGLKPLQLPNDESTRFYAVFWRGHCPSFVKAVMCAKVALMKSVTPFLQHLLTPC